MAVPATGRLPVAVRAAWRAAGCPVLTAEPTPPPAAAAIPEGTRARAWARSVGMAVPATGRLPGSVLAAWRAAGSPSAPPPACGEPGCNLPARSLASPPLCDRCYQWHKRHGDLPQPRSAAPEASPAWKGDRIGYAGAHERINTTHGRAALYVCNGCSTRAEHWALMPDAAHRLTDPDTGQDYSPDPSDYRPMCRPCHSRMDGAWRSMHRDPAPGMLPAGCWPAPTLPEVPRLPLRTYGGVRP